MTVDQQRQQTPETGPRAGSRLLFLHPMPGLERQRAYLETCKLLKAQGLAEPVFVYTGPQIDVSEADFAVYNFDAWVRDNAELIARTDARTLAQSYPESALWLGVVSERLVSNYSFLNGSYRMVNYSAEDLQRLTKAIVLFYQWILDREAIDLVLAQHPDNIFSTLAFEMCRSRPQQAFLLFPDYYWQQERYLAFDDKFFTSRKLEATYRQLMENYDTLAAPRAQEAADYLHRRVSNDPSETRKDILPKMTVGKNIRNALATIGNRRSWLRFKKPDVLEMHATLWIPTVLRAFAMRNYNLLRTRFANFYSDSLPDGPFVYLPLQRVPEAAMLTRATGYLNQLSFVQVVSAALPMGYTLVVKDHPRSRGFVSTQYHRQMADLPNVMVARDTSPNGPLLEKSDLVVTIAGTLGLQKLMQGDSVLMFGRKYYEFLAGAMRAEDLNSLPYRLKDILVKGERVDPELCKRSIACFALALIDCSHFVKGDAKRLHQTPGSLAKLIGSIIKNESATLRPDQATGWVNGAPPHDPHHTQFGELP